MAKKIQFSLIYRDMWQSSGKFQPRKDQLVRIAPVFVEMGCFARVETNGGAFEQVNLLAGEKSKRICPCIYKDITRCWYTNTHARPWFERTTYVSSAR